MKFNRNFLIIFGILICISCHKKEDPLQYIDPNKPHLIAQIFAPNFISKDDESEFGSVFSKDGNEFYYAVDTDGKAEIRYTKRNGRDWSSPITIISDPKYGFNDPFLSPDENELFYISNLPKNDLDTIDDIDIWYSKKIDEQWSKPINAGELINSDKNEYYISFTTSGTMYFASNKNAEAKRAHDFDIFSAKKANNEFTAPVKLSDSINTGRYEADVFIAPDESYIIFSSARRAGYGNGDLYISFKDEFNQWKEAKNMGEIVNSEAHELCPFVSHDGKYLFYTSRQDIYWISAEILKSYR